MSKQYVNKTESINPSNRLGKISKNDIRRFLPGMFANSINSGDFRHIQNFLFSFLEPQCVFNAEITFPPLFHIPSKFNFIGAQLFSHYLLGLQVMFPDTIFTVKDSRIITASNYSGSRIEMDIEFQLTKTAHIPMELWIPPMQRMNLLYQARSLQDMLYAVHCPLIPPLPISYTNYCTNPSSEVSSFSSAERTMKRVANSGVDRRGTAVAADAHTEEEGDGDDDRFSRRSKTAAETQEKHTTTAAITTKSSNSASREVSSGDFTLSSLTDTAETTSTSVGCISEHCDAHLLRAMPPAYFQYSGGGDASLPTGKGQTEALKQLTAQISTTPTVATPSTSSCAASASADCVLMLTEDRCDPTRLLLPAQARIPDRFVDDLHAAAVLLHSPLPLRLVGQYVLYLDESNHIVHITLSAAPAV